MLIRFSATIELLETDDESIVIFDPETGDTHFFAETAYFILKLLREDPDVDQLIEKLALEYAVGLEELRLDVNAFLTDLIQKGILQCESNPPLLK